MLPGAYEFSWSAGHVIFVGFFILAFAMVAGYAGWAVFRAWRDRRAGHAGAVRWHETFELLPPERRICRHVLQSGTEDRTCDHGFDCEHCEQHAALAEDAAPLTGVARVHGLTVLPGDFYGRGHTTLRPMEDGLVEVWPDALAQILLRECRIRPRRGDGARLDVGDAAFLAECPGGPLRILTPIGGRIVDHIQLDEFPVLRIRPDRPLAEQPQLLHGTEAVRWLESELYRLGNAVTPAAAGQTLADGGAIREDLVKVMPGVDWDRIREEFFLDV